MSGLGNPLIDVCWGLWAVVWTVGWIANAFRGPRTERTATGWSFWMWAIALVLLTGAHIRPWASVVPTGSLLPAAGALVIVAGTAFTLWARWTLGAMWSSQPSVKAGHKLHTDGPYAITRHPIYTGMMAMMVGSALMQGSTWIAVTAIFAVYVALKMREEERLMTATFGEQYERYRSMTPQIIPGVRRGDR